jgi:hypothetical protein
MLMHGASCTIAALAKDEIRGARVPFELTVRQFKILDV